MFFVQTTFKDNSAIPYSGILDSIDEKLAQYGQIQLDNIRYHFNTNINYDNFEDLLVYRSIFQDKLYCDYCLCDIDINKIINKIKQLTNSIC